MNDQALTHLTRVLEKGFIWAINVGENFRISRGGWEQFAEDLGRTNVTHMYAGSETTVSGALKVKMRDKIRVNRVHASHRKRHQDFNRADIISAISNMWFNPRASGKWQRVLNPAAFAAEEEAKQASQKAAEPPTYAPKCERCFQEHDGQFGSGRYCSQLCSRSKALHCERCGYKHDGQYGSGRFCDR